MPIKLYHGSPSKTDQKAFGVPGNRTPQITPGRPFFATSDLAYATHFSRGGVVSEVSLDVERMLDLHEDEQLQRLLQIYNHDSSILAKEGAWDEDVEGDIYESAYRLLESQDVMNALLDEGYTAVVLPEDIERRVTSYAALDASAIRFVRVVKPRRALEHESEPSMT